MNKQTIIGILLIFAIFLLSEQFLWKKPKTAPAPQQQTEQTQPETAPETETGTPAQPGGLPDFFFDGDDLSEINHNIVLENDSLKIVFSSKGAVIREIYLKKFLLTDKSVVQLVPAGKTLANTILLTDSGSTDLKNLTFDYSEIEENGQKGILFSFTPEPDRIIEKKFVLGHNYSVKYNQKVHSVYPINGYSIEFNAGIRDTEDYLKAKTRDYKFFAQVDNLLNAKDLAKLNKGSVTLSGKTEWAAIRSKYFVLALKDIEPVLSNSVRADTANASPAFTMTTKRDKSSIDWDEDFLLYFGPAEMNLLRSHGSGMENITERGWSWLRWLVSIFAWILSFLYKLIPNYGVVILIFSVFIKIILHPFTHKSMDASLKMQKIQPRVSAIQQQYKNDPKQMQMELSKLYKEAGASPLGGCLPLLLQMPVFFALYTVLRSSLDMRQAHFVGWLKDLSEPDPYWILPILMGVFMIIQQLMMKPNKQQLEQMDEKQQAMQQSQKMMTWIMPVALFFVFKSMPAGLVLYWTVFNILSIIQQYYLQKHLNKKELQ
jgi:YidC/Oxa1 family membrane protein insertase